MAIVLKLSLHWSMYWLSYLRSCCKTVQEFDLQIPMMMDEVRVTVTNSIDVPHVAFLGFVGELTPQLT